MQLPAPFEYERATSVEHALQLLRDLGPDARILAGGHSLLPMMKLRLASPEYLIDIDDLAGELGYVSETGDEIRIGAMTRHRELLESPLLARRAAIFTDAERVIADPVVRNRGTIGGALCQADPSEDLSAVCAAVGARMVIRGLDGERIVDMPEFYRGPYRTAVGADELLVEIRIALKPPHRQRLREGRSPGRRLGGGRRRRLADARRRGGRRGRDRAGRGGRRRHAAPRPRQWLLGREPAEDVLEQAAGAWRRRPATGVRSARLGRIQATRRRGARAPGPYSGRRSAPARRCDAGDGRGQRRGAHAGGRVAGAAGAFPARRASG